jgi:glycerophosphoryl diester phosphodiesterase
MAKLLKHMLLATLGLILIACSLENPSTPTSEDTHMSKNKPLVIAHRGARSLAPENTLAAAQKAYDLGADLWELDVAVTADGELVLMHDDTLERTCNVKEVFPDRAPWNVWDFTLAEIQTLDCGSWFNRKDPFGQVQAGKVPFEDQKSYTGEQAPTLKAALQFTQEHHWRVNVELKEQPTEPLTRASIEKTVSLITEMGMDDGLQAVISSFNHEYLRRVRELNPNIPVQAIISKLIRNLPDYLDELGAEACNPKINTWSYQKMAAMESQGVHFNVWTVNDELVMKALINSGVSGIITDYPQTLIALLEQQ